MTLIAVLALMLASFGAVAWPFLGPRLRGGDGRPKAPQPWDDLLSQRDTAYQALKELEGLKRIYANCVPNLVQDERDVVETDLEEAHTTLEEKEHCIK